MYIQGDVYLTETKKVPEDAKRVSTKNGRFILAEGEATGHAHAVLDDELEVFERDGILYIKASRPFTIVHEEHAPVIVKAGIWEVDRQREYDPFLEETRIVMD